MADEPVYCKAGCGHRLRKPESIALGYGEHCYRELFGHAPPRPPRPPRAARAAPVAYRPTGGMLHETEDDVLLDRPAVVAVSVDRPAPPHSELPPAAQFTTEKCGYCPARIIWAVTRTGADMPVDAVVKPGGNVLLVPQTGNTQPLAVVLGNPRDRFGKRLRWPHHASCPKGDQLRRRGPG